MRRVCGIMTIPSIFIALAMGLGCTAFQVSVFSTSTVGENIATAPYLGLVRGGGGGAKRHSSVPFFPKMTSSDENESDGAGSVEAERLRQTASKLRAEAQAAEKALNRSPSATSTAEGTKYVKPMEYSDLRDSCWEITYRFANEPESSDDSDDNKNNENTPQRKFYGGKLRIQFRGDGYTDIIPPSEGVDASSSNAATFPKVWGWDLETSAEDSLDYLLFSADVTLPPPVSTTERFYFQARVDRDGKEEEVLSLRDGSVTVKRNIKAPAGGWWGIFRGADGILAQFRQVGEFLCRPIENPNM